MAPLKIIGAGFGRTGTLTLRHALDYLGYQTHHMDKVLLDPTQDPDLFRHAYEYPDEPVDWERAFQGYDAAVDWPAAAFFEKLLAKYPDAKVILTVRDPEEWYRSVASTIHEWPCVDETWPSHILRARAMARVIVRDGELGGPRFHDREYTIGRFKQNIERVKQLVKPENLLILNLGEGWEKLCPFLGRDIPPIPWPHKNKGSNFAALVCECRDRYLENLERLSNPSTNGSTDSLRQ
ncbi:P-loop containing nucleoside triphosphate hydrolase protein [Radiomyces spectabilis]|uniref:P-loop containing nucleoside triphosphate hydrolase protein n=1 Tax=Radiomyces spectabilis TaxID=64574 RepID=UPI00221EDE75|nr:P-loop containing nucleoside triphosphate hydrolase protein [Radiomyces spectabilis]KAI8384858.1 P-loop containing nucleoside triphosphate hydrolase protein [Radiomyces spectabilis]